MNPYQFQRLWEFCNHKRQWTGMGKSKSMHAWQESKVRAKQEVPGEARKEGRIMRFATSTDLCHHQKSEIDDVPQITQDVQCEKAMWSKTTLDLVLSVRSKVLLHRTGIGHHLALVWSCRTSKRRCVGIHSSGTEISFRVIEILEAECPVIWIRLSWARCLKSGTKYKILLFSWEETCTDVFEQDYHGNDNDRKFVHKNTGTKFQDGSVYIVIDKNELFQSVYVDEFSMENRSIYHQCETISRKTPLHVLI